MLKLKARREGLSHFIEEVNGLKVQLEAAKAEEGAAMVAEGKPLMDATTSAFIESLPADAACEIKEAAAKLEALCA